MRQRKTRKRLQSRQSSDEFYSRINDDWLEKTELPKTEARITQAYFIQKEINKELAQVIRQQKAGTPMSDLVASWTAAEHQIPTGLTPLFQLMNSMDSPSDIVARIGWMNRYGISCPLSIYAQGDERNHRRCCVFIEEGNPRIGIPEYWLDSEFVGHRRAYAQYVKRLASVLGLPSLKSGYGAEREFAHVFPTYSERRSKVELLTWTDLQAKYRTIDWTAMLTAWGLREEELPNIRYNISAGAFIHHFQVRLVRWSLDRWRGWFALLVAQWIAGCSPHGPLRSAWFDYSRRFLQGSVADERPEEMRNAIVRTMMPNSLGRLWVEHHCDPQLKRRIVTMIRNVQGAAAAQLRTTSWMRPNTRAAAVRKLRKMDVQVCWPDIEAWRPHEAPCALSATDLIENLLAIGKVGTDVNQEMLRSGDCRHPYGDNWGKPVYEVNAYYYPDENRFLLPAAILRSPFYDPAKTAPWNYGSIGATIGHELCHAFDSDGRNYDENGDKRDWWTAHDTAEYKKRAARMVRTYSAEKYRGLEVDGELTLVENIADLGGIGFALGGLETALGRPPTKTELREFFTSFAVSWRSKDRLKRAAELLATNSHAPPMLRVNQVLQQLDSWYDAFDIGPDHSDWIAPERRIRFFA